jgi:hypothetical protein
MEIREAKGELSKLTQDIQGLIRVFEIKTDCRVESVTVNRVLTLPPSGAGFRTPTVEIKVTL